MLQKTSGVILHLASNRSGSCPQTETSSSATSLSISTATSQLKYPVTICDQLGSLTLAGITWHAADLLGHSQLIEEKKNFMVDQYVLKGKWMDEHWVSKAKQCCGEGPLHHSLFSGGNTEIIFIYPYLCNPAAKTQCLCYIRVAIYWGLRA